MFLFLSTIVIQQIKLFCNLIVLMYVNKGKYRNIKPGLSPGLVDTNYIIVNKATLMITILLWDAYISF